MLYLTREEGQGLVEYGLVLILIATVVVLILTLIGPQIGNLYSRVVPCIGSPTPAYCLG